MQLTGFSLNCLCHRFGRRGRLMCSSLAARDPASPPLHLRIFYTRPQDREACYAGLQAGWQLEAVEFFQVPEPDILKRARLFSRCTSPLSHTVFMDSDLWFPADFWPHYAAALSAQPPSYSSTWSYNVDTPMAELLLDGSPVTLDRVVEMAGPVPVLRHREGWGRLGIFQCCPTQFAQYPDVDHVGVEAYDVTFAEQARKRCCSEELANDSRVQGSLVYHLDHERDWHGIKGEA